MAVYQIMKDANHKRERGRERCKVQAVASNWNLEPPGIEVGRSSALGMRKSGAQRPGSIAGLACRRPDKGMHAATRMPVSVTAAWMCCRDAESDNQIIVGVRGASC